MKRFVQSVGIGVVLGLSAVIFHEVVSSERFQDAVKESVGVFQNIISSRKDEDEGGQTYKKGEKFKDPYANQAWVEQQWEEVLN